MAALLSDESIGPTALYTGHVWSRNGLSHPALDTSSGRALYLSLEPAMAASRLAGGPTFEGMLLARHRVIDDILETAITDGRVGSVVEIACGMAPRGWRFSQRHAEALTYVEADLPAMAERKRRALERAGTLGEHHRVASLDARARSGATSLRALLAGLDHTRGVAVVTEGLLNYLDEAAVRDLWARIASGAQAFAHGLYVCDIGLGTREPGAINRGAVTGLSAFVRSRVQLHFAGSEGAEQALLDAGFATATTHRPEKHPAAGDRRDDPGARRLRVLEART